MTCEAVEILLLLLYRCSSALNLERRVQLLLVAHIIITQQLSHRQYCSFWRYNNNCDINPGVSIMTDTYRNNA